MATERDWAKGYYEQASADMRGARVVQGAEPSVLAMLLQMVLEKIAKAALLRSGGITVAHARGTHRATSTLLLQLGHNRRACERLGLNVVTVRTRLAPLVERLEASQRQSASTRWTWTMPRISVGDSVGRHSMALAAP